MKKYFSLTCTTIIAGMSIMEGATKFAALQSDIKKYVNLACYSNKLIFPNLIQIVLEKKTLEGICIQISDSDRDVYENLNYGTTLYDPIKYLELSFNLAQGQEIA